MNQQPQVGFEMEWSGGLGASGQNFSLMISVESHGPKTMESLKSVMLELRKKIDHKNLYRDFPGEFHDGQTLTDLASSFAQLIKKSGDFKIHRLQLQMGHKESAVIQY